MIERCADVCWQGRAFMEEAHIHVVASLLARTIVVYDDRQRAEGRPGILMRYEPGYVSTATVVKKKSALRLLEHGAAVLWIHLTPGHFTTLRSTTP